MRIKYYIYEKKNINKVVISVLVNACFIYFCIKLRPYSHKIMLFFFLYRFLMNWILFFS